MLGTGMLLGCVAPEFFFGPEPPKLYSPIKPEHYITKTSLLSISPKDRNNAHVENTWIHKYKSVR
jgi:hypothetical protein